MGCSSSRTSSRTSSSSLFNYKSKKSKKFNINTSFPANCSCSYTSTIPCNCSSSSNFNSVSCLCSNNTNMNLNNNNIDDYLKNRNNSNNSNNSNNNNNNNNNKGEDLVSEFIKTDPFDTSIHSDSHLNNQDNNNDNDEFITNHFSMTLPLLNSLDYSINYELGEGGYGKVFYGKNIINGKEVALKFFGYTENEPLHSQILHEMIIMSKLLQIDSLPKIYGYFMDTKEGLISGKIHHHHSYPVLVMELLHGVDLFEGIYERRIVSNERDIAQIFRALLNSLNSIHKLKFIHRDIKLENLMISKIISTDKFDNNITIKIIDCGTMVQLTSDNEKDNNENNIYHDFTLVGTPGYIAPESLQYFDYSYSSDIWQLGCCLYSMLSGTPAFSIRDDFMRSNWRYNPMTGSAWNSISFNAKDLVHKMLQRNPKFRPTIDEILNHPWMTTESSTIELGDSYFSRVKYLALRQKMKNFFLDTKVMEKGRDRRKKLKKIIPLLRQMSSCSWGESTSTISPKENPPVNNIETQKITMKSLRKIKKSNIEDNNPESNNNNNIEDNQIIQTNDIGVEEIMITSNTNTTEITFDNDNNHDDENSNGNNNNNNNNRLKHKHSYSPRLSENSDPTPRTLEFLKITPEAFENKLENFKGAVMQSIIQHSHSSHSYQSNYNCNNNNNNNNNNIDIDININNSHPANLHQVGCLDYETFARLMIESDLSTLSSKRVFNIFDIDRKGVINMKDFLLTMAALHPTHSQGNSFRHKWKWPSSKKFDKLQENINNEYENSDSPQTRNSRSNSFTTLSPTEEELTENMSRYYFDIFDIHNRGYIDIEQLKLSIGCFIDYSLIDTSNRSLLSQHNNNNNNNNNNQQQQQTLVKEINENMNENTNDVNNVIQNNTPSNQNHSPINSESELISTTRIDEMDIESLFRLIDTQQTGKINYEQFSIFFKDLRKSMS